MALRKHTGIFTAAKAQNPPAATMKRILLVEDIADLAAGLQRNLDREGHRASIAATATAALETAMSEVPDLVVLVTVLGTSVVHIFDERHSDGHRLAPPAQVVGGRLAYPA
jgi:DNA-binding NtrC family response regulator